MRQDPRYRFMLRDHPQPWCWFCGRDESHRPDWWHAPFLVERAHIVNKPRRLDRRAVVLLCSLCHRIFHGDTFRFINHHIRQEHLLWLKREFDRPYYDRAWLRKHSVGNPPQIIPAPRRREYFDRRRLRPHADATLPLRTVWGLEDRQDLTGENRP